VKTQFSTIVNSRAPFAKDPQIEYNDEKEEEEEEGEVIGADGEEEGDLSEDGNNPDENLIDNSFIENDYRVKLANGTVIKISKYDNRA
jgi:hypothetical protein